MSEMTPEEFWAALAPAEEPVAVSYRLYYDDQGLPLFYSMQDEPGNYIEIDQITYASPPAHARVVDGKLKTLTMNPIAKLVPGNTGIACDVNDVCIVVTEDSPHTKWSIKKHDPN
jgi:hypothetical protein